MHFEYPQVTFQVPTWVPFDHKNIFLFINWNTKQDQKSTRCDISYVFQDYPVFPDILLFPDFPVLPDFLEFKVFLNFSVFLDFLVFPDFPDF